MTPEAFLAEHPLTAAVDVLLPDLNGILRGKRLPFGALAGALGGEFHFPTGLYGLDSTGTNADGALELEEAGTDRPVGLDPATLRPVPWRGGTAQILGGLLDHDGSPYFADPRGLLRQVAARFGEIGLTPVAAIELEFHLFDTASDGPGRPQPLAGEIGAFLPERLGDHEAFLALVDEYAEAQDLSLKGVLAEYAPGQFEVNLAHWPDPVRAADEAVMLKRLVRAAAIATGRRATFMAKPFEGQSGSGLHVHLSLLDRAGRNVFGETPDGEAALRSAVAGLLALMPESALPCLPNANSYRRLLPGSFAPVYATWSVNNRTVAVRVPPGPAAARRVEHRVAGADANPYLVLAAVLAGVHHGIANALEPGPPVTGDAYADVPAGAGLPLSWGAAIEAFRRGEVLRSYLGEPFCALYAACRAAERDRFRAKVTPTEYAWYLGSA